MRTPDYNQDVNRLFLEGINHFPPHVREKEQGFPSAQEKTQSKKIDLHGFTLEQALNRVEAEIKNSLTLDKIEWRFVTGKGNHSPGLRPVLQDGVMDFLDAHKHYYHIEFEQSGGIFRVWKKRQSSF